MSYRVAWMYYLREEGFELLGEIFPAREAALASRSPDLALEDGQVGVWDEEFGRRVVVSDEDVRSFGFTGSFPYYEQTETKPMDVRVLYNLMSSWGDWSCAAIGAKEVHDGT